MQIKTMIQSTPNPNALKFILNIPVKNEGKVTYKNAGQCQHNPMAAALFTIPNIAEVYFFDNYITVTQDGSVEWEQIEEQIKKIVLEYAEHHDPNFKVEEDKKFTAIVSDDPEIAKISTILDNTIRPALQMDGGDLQIVGFDGMHLTVHYQGACGSCPSSSMGTLKAIEGILRDQYNPEIVVLNDQEGPEMLMKTLTKYTSKEIKARLNEIPGWGLEAGAKSIWRQYTLKNFVAAVDLINKIKDIAESENHHPDLHLTGYKNLKVVLYTHTLGGVSENDLIVAAKIGELKHV